MAGDFSVFEFALQNCYGHNLTKGLGHRAKYSSDHKIMTLAFNLQLIKQNMFYDLSGANIYLLHD